MWLQFFAQNFQFAVSILACLTFVAVSWLYFDSWKNARKFKELFRWTGFLVLGLSYLLQGSIVELSFSDPLFAISSYDFVNYVRIVGYTLVVISLLKDPLMKTPNSEGISESMFSKPEDPVVKSHKKSHAIFATGSLSYFLVPTLSLGVAVLYWIRATKGLERHLKPIAIAFSFIFLSDVFAIASRARDTTNPALFDYVQAFGYFWFASYIFLLIGIALLGRWIWGYLVKRFFSQFVMLFMLIAVSIFIVTSLSFTGLLLRNVRSSVIDNLENTTSVLQFALDTKVEKAAASAKLLSNDKALIEALAVDDRETLLQVTDEYLGNNKLTDFYIVNAFGQVLVRGQDPDAWGDSLSSDPFVRRSLIGDELAGVVADEGILAPSLFVRGSTPVRAADSTIVGVIVASIQLDSAFLEGIQQSDQIDASLFAENTLSATTIGDEDGQVRAIGSQIANAALEEAVLVRAETYEGATEINQIRYNTVNTPILDYDNVPVGILSIADKESNILKIASKSIELSFLFQSILVIVLIAPIAYISKKIEDQI